LTQAEGDAAYESDGAVAAHEGAANPHPAYLTEAEADALYVELDQTEWIDLTDTGETTLHTHPGGSHPDLATHDTLGLATDAELTAHEGAANPHPTYLTQAEGDALYEDDGAVATHAGASDPHTGYQKESEKGSANGYASLDGSGLVPDAQIPAAVARDSEVTSAVSDHEGAANPHPTYETSAEAQAKVDTHVNDSSAAHAASAISYGGGAGMSATDVEAAIDELATEKSDTGHTHTLTPSVGGVILDPSGARNVMVWRAPYACTVTNVRGHRKGGTGATVNARKNQASNFLSSALSLATADQWDDGGAVQNTSLAAGDDIEIMLVSITGAVTEIAIQVDLTRTV
jgi:hypothetical protein